MNTYNNAQTQDVITSRYTATYEIHNEESFSVIVTAKTEEEAHTIVTKQMRFDPRLVMVDYTLSFTVLNLVDSLYL